MRYETLEKFLKEFQQGKVYVYCKTKEESDRVQVFLGKQGWTWFNGIFPLNYSSRGKLVSGWDKEFSKKKGVIWFSDPYYPKCASCESIDYRKVEKPTVEANKVIQLFSKNK